MWKCCPLAANNTVKQSTKFIYNIGLISVPAALFEPNFVMRYFVGYVCEHVKFIKMYSEIKNLKVLRLEVLFRVDSAL